MDVKADAIVAENIATFTRQLTENATRTGNGLFITRFQSQLSHVLPLPSLFSFSPSPSTPNSHLNMNPSPLSFPFYPLLISTSYMRPTPFSLTLWGLSLPSSQLPDMIPSSHSPPTHPSCSLHYAPLINALSEVIACVCITVTALSWALIALTSLGRSSNRGVGTLRKKEGRKKRKRRKL